MSDHGSRRTWGQGPSGSRFGAQKGDLPLTKAGAPCNFCLIKFLPKCKVEATEAPRTPFMHPIPGVGGWVGVPGRPPPQEPSPSSTTSIPNFILICPLVRISLENKHTHPHCPLFSRFTFLIGANKNKFCFQRFFLTDTLMLSNWAIHALFFV